MANTYKSISLDAPAGSSNTPYSMDFLVAGWTLNGPVYEISLIENTHEKGTIINVQVFEKIGSDYKEVEVDITVAINGDVKIEISSATDLRFDGRLVILGE